MNFKRLVLMLSLAAGFSFPAQAVFSASDLVGRWETTIEFGKMKIKIAVTVKQTPDGKIEGKIDMPEQGARDVPVNAMLLNYPAVRWEIDPFNTAFNGKVNEAGD